MFDSARIAQREPSPQAVVFVNVSSESTLPRAKKRTAAWVMLASAAVPAAALSYVALSGASPFGNVPDDRSSQARPSAAASDSPSAEDWGDPSRNAPTLACGLRCENLTSRLFGPRSLGLDHIDDGEQRRPALGLSPLDVIAYGASASQVSPSGAPRVRLGTLAVSGRLSLRPIHRVTRRHLGWFHLCYDAGLRKNPNLQGRVVVRFVIDRYGLASNVGGGGDLPDGEVVSCVTRVFYGLRFPAPRAGIATVSYPLIFSPAT